MKELENKINQCNNTISLEDLEKRYSDTTNEELFRSVEDQVNKVIKTEKRNRTIKILASVVTAIIVIGVNSKDTKATKMYKEACTGFATGSVVGAVMYMLLRKKK